jgi:hypothetical protein
MVKKHIPNFFIAGAAKAGTTSLYHYLKQHPDIFMSPVKEPSHFSQEMRPENYSPELRVRLQRAMDDLRVRLHNGLEVGVGAGIVDRREDYLKLFEGVREERAVGEASVAYLWSATAAKEIMAFNPAAKIVLVLRHPAERAFSNYIYYLSDGHITQSFSEHIALCLKDSGPMGLCHPFLEIGLYGQQMERLLSHIPREQVRVWLYEETTANPEKFFAEVLKFLGVDTGFTPDRSRRHLQMAVPKMASVTQMLRRGGVWDGVRRCIPQGMRPMLKKAVYRQRGAVGMNSDDRRFLVNYYRDDVMKLERVIERDLSRWLQ